MCQSKQKNTQKKLFIDESFSRTSSYAQQPQHPISSTNCNQRESLHPTSLGSALPKCECLGESAHPPLHSNLHSSLENSRNVTAESAV